MTLSLTAMASRLRIVALLSSLFLLPAVFAFTPVPPVNARLMTSRSLGVPLDLDPTFAETSSIIISAAKATTVNAASVTAATGSSGSSAVSNFFVGSAVFIGIVGTFKWNTAETSEQIRNSWEKIVDSTSTFGTAPPKPSSARMESSVASEAVPVPVATPATTSDDATTSTKATSIPNAKDASSPQDLIEMMKNVGDATAPKKKRFIVRLFKKVVMPWKKWSNL